jgi:hypothetical protein
LSVSTSATLGATGRPLSFKQFDNGMVVIGGKLIGIADLAKRHGEIDFAGMNEICDVWVSHGHAPACATLQAKLAAPELLVEIAAVTLG